MVLGLTTINDYFSLVMAQFGIMDELRNVKHVGKCVI